MFRAEKPPARFASLPTTTRGQYGVRKSARMGEKLMRRAGTMVPAHGSARVGATVAAASIAAAGRGWQQ
jgi:hypothetical protein